MQKVYSRINWENGELGDTPLNEANLNRMDNAINEIDNRVVEFDTSKLSVTDSQNLIADWQMDETTGIITVTRKNGDKIIFDLNVEKIPASFSLSDDGILTMMTADGTIFTANIGAMIPVLTFNSSSTIGVTVSGEGANKTYSFNVLDGSITDTKLESGYLAKVKLNADNAATSEEYAGLYANKSEAWAVGQKNGEDVPSTDETYHNNAKYWAEQAKTATNVGNGTLTIKQGSNVKGTFSANQSEDKEIVVSDSANDIKMSDTKFGNTVEEAIGYVAENAGGKVETKTYAEWEQLSEEEAEGRLFNLINAPYSLSVAEVNNKLVASDGLNFKFATDGEGNYGYLGADDSFIPFKKGLTVTKLGGAGTYNLSSYEGYKDFAINKNIFIVASGSGSTHGGSGGFNNIGGYVAFSAPSASYTASSGTLKVNNGYANGGGWNNESNGTHALQSKTITATAYLVY